MQRTLVILAVGLAPNLIGPHTPNLSRLAARGGLRPLNTVTPAVTCTVQSTLATGLMPSGHGAVANGWYFKDLRQILLWRQPNNLVAGEKIWDAGKARNPDFTCAKMFWWYNMYASADWTDTPRPMYPSDGRKIPDHYTQPMELRDELDARLGQFPLFKFWGPVADITSTDWITKATLHIMETRQPTLTLTYLPHLDYNLQRLGPDLDHPRLQMDLQEIDACCGQLIEHAEKTGQHVLVVSEYGITKATDAVSSPTVGSSISHRSAPETSRRVSARRRRWPDDRYCTRTSASSVRFRSASGSVNVELPSAIAAQKSKVSATVSVGFSAS